MFEIVGKTSIDFIGMRKISLGISTLLVVIGFFAVFRLFTGGGNMGIDFIGGTAVQLKFEKPLDIERARAALAEGGVTKADLQEITTENKLLIRVKEQNSAEEKVAERITSVFRSSFPDNAFEIDSTTVIGPSIGKRLRKDTLVAVFFALAGIVVYIAFRFEFHFGVAAAIATMHDVIAVTGILYLLDKEFTILIVTSLLTLAGYSITDTVVIFDRIRENMRKRKGGDLSDNINRAINEVLGRTVVTTLTTLLVLLSLFFFGGDVLHDFAMALLLGVVVGNYSSLFVASPIVVAWSRWQKTRQLAASTS